MGEIGEMIQDGILCKDCGAYVGDEKLRALGCEIIGDHIKAGPGYPIACEDCDEE